MEPFQQLGRILAIAGFIVMLAGIIFWMGAKPPFLGHLPGDFSFKGKNVNIYFPLASSILISIFLSLMIFLIRKFL